MKKIILLSCLLILLPLSVLASTINVPSDQPTIQAGIDASVYGDIVLLADGTYTGPGNYNIDFKGRSITVKSSGGAENCIIDCQQNGRGFSVSNGETVTFEGLTVKNGDAGESNWGGGVYMIDSDIVVVDCTFTFNSASYGGAVYCSTSSTTSTSSSSIINCTFTSNSSSGSGGAVKYSSASTPDKLSYSITNCTFTSNSASNSGGAVSSVSTSITNCTFTSNSAYNSGAVSSSNTTVGCSLPVYYTSITNCTFTSNSASDHGGAVGYGLSTYSSSSLTNCTFTSNSAFNGGAVYYSLCCSPLSSITNCTFTSNSATDAGGAINFHHGSYPSASSSLTNCTFASNSAAYGGAVYNSFVPASYRRYPTSSITNCTFTLNEVTEQGGVIWCDIPLSIDDSITLKNCILWGNTASEGSEIYEKEKPIIVTYSNIQGGHDGEGNIDADPLFVDAANDDLHLQGALPCIDTGTADGAPSDDLDGNFRPVGSGYDMGAYEYQGPIFIDSFTANPTTGKPPLPVNFTCTAHDDTNTITGYQWNFGDGSTEATLTGTVQHTYTIHGTFSATCTVINDNSDQTTTFAIIEVTNPIAVAGQDQIIPDNSVELNGSASYNPNGTISSWDWALTHTENSSYNRSASGEIVDLTDLEFGHYIVVLTVTGNLGAQGVDEMFLCVAASSLKYTQSEYGQAQQDSYSSGYTAGQDDCKQCPIREDAEGNKFLDGPLTIEDNGMLTIQ